MSRNGTSPTLDDVYDVLGRERGKHPILLHINAGEKGPRWSGWSKITYEETLVANYQAQLRAKANTGVLLGVTDDLGTIDCDTDTLLSEFLRLDPQLENTLRTRGAAGAQLWAYFTGNRPHAVQALRVHKDSPLAVGAREAPDADGYVSVGEFRAEGGQSVIRGIHPDSFNYTWPKIAAPITIAFDSIIWPADIRLPWLPKRARTKAATPNAARDEDLLRQAIDRLTVAFLWAHFGYPDRGRKNPVRSPWFPDDKDTSFSVYNEGRNFKDHDPGRANHRGDSFDFYQLATGQSASEAFPDFVTLAGLGDELNQNRQPKAKKSQGTKAADPRPIVMHPNDDSYISEFASELGAILKAQGFYRYNGRAVQVRDVMIKGRNGKEHQVKKLVELTVPIFSTIIENYCRPMRRKRKKLVHESITLEIAARTLVCLDFVLALSEIKLWTDVRLPIRRGEAIVLTQPGYDPVSGVYTSADAPEVDESLTIEEADKRWRQLMAEFCFPKSGKTEKDEADERKREPERERAIAVSLAAALTPQCIYLLSEKAKRPGFAVTANSEGAGKTLLLSFGMVAKLGFVPIGSAPRDEEEMRKILDAAVHQAVPIIFFDNLKGHLSSGQLEAFITSATRSYRLLGTTNYNEGENLSTVYLTANFATYSPDLRRRLLAVELILEEARAEERIIKNYLDEDGLIRRRSELLSILWTFIRYWHENGEPSATKLLPSFENWSAIVAGIVEASGYSSPCQLAILKTGGDTDTQDMEKLIGEMVPKSEYRFSDLIDKARDHSLFPKLVPEEGDLEKWQTTRLGIIIRKFVGRIFSVPDTDHTGKITIKAYRFCLSGDTPRTRRYSIEQV
jgi:hypothetical protein